MDKKLKIAIVHDYLHEYGGAEGLVSAISEIYKAAPVYTATYDKENMRKAGVFLSTEIIYPKWKTSIPDLVYKYLHKLFIANLPFYFMRLNLSKYDLIISSTAHFAKGIKTTNKQLHICYIHTPPRFLYGLPGEIRKRSYWYWNLLLWPLDTFLRYMDKRFAKNPDFLLCNSKTVQDRIKKVYKRESVIIHPFPKVVFKKEYQTSGDYYLVISRLVDFKNVDLCIKVCGKNNIKLKVAGIGTSEEYLRILASKYESVEMLGFVNEEEKLKLIGGCKGMLCTVKHEDFGMVPLEAFVYGKPVIALKDSGYLETVIDGKTGIFFSDLTQEALYKAIKKFENTKFNKEFIMKHASHFSKERFKKEFKDFVDNKVNQKFGIDNTK